MLKCSKSFGTSRDLSCSKESHPRATRDLSSLQDEIETRFLASDLGSRSTAHPTLIILTVSAPAPPGDSVFKMFTPGSDP